MCLSLVCNIVLVSLFPLPHISFTFCSCSPHPPAHSHVFLHRFCRCFVYFMWHWFDAFYFFSFIICETCLIKNWFVLTQGWLRTWPIWSFSHPLWFKYVGTQSSICSTLSVICFYIFINMKLISALWCCCFSFAAFVLLCDLSHNKAWIYHYHLG